ncbi:MAG TPA: hypothetical protein VMJ93_08125 [Verrucomicrobiae bacterium]|nr:hypothetical protein [Verrucomicrobiae bacterium]
MKMRNREGIPGAGLPAGAAPAVAPFLASLALLGLILAGCAAPGEPIERRPPVPTAITDLAAAPQGSDVALTFTLPNETVQRRPLKSPPAVEIYRGFSPAGAAPKNLSLVVTIPPAMLGQYTAEGQIHFSDVISPQDFAQHPGEQAVYSVRTRASEKRESDDSNIVAVPLAIPPQPVADAKAQVTHDAILLTWTAPPASVTGAPVTISGFRVYRAELQAAPSAASPSPPRRKAAFLLLGETDPSKANFADTHFAFGATYEYTIRSVFSAAGAARESGDSNLVLVTPRDIFPPSAPVGLEVIFVPAQGSAPASLDLSWAINPETDVVGYNVYRSEREGSPGERLNPALLRTPAFRDMNAVPGLHYFYSVTAVSDAGLESAASAAVSGGIPAASR